jgi:ribosome-associated protein
VHCSTSRSQHQNKEEAFARLAQEIRKALLVPKRRVATKISKGAKKARLESKSKHGLVKKLRSQKIKDE